LLPDSLAVHAAWRKLFVTHGVSGVQVHDARLAAAMRVHGVKRTLTFNDRDFARCDSSFPATEWPATTGAINLSICAEKDKKKFRPPQMRTRTFIVAFSVRDNLGAFGPLHLLGNIQTGKCKKIIELSSDPGQRFRPQPPTYLRNIEKEKRQKESRYEHVFARGVPDHIAGPWSSRATEPWRPLPISSNSRLLL
jgi:hypothetical protein